MANILASSIKNKPHLAAFDAMMELRFSDMDSSPVLMNLIDTAPPNALQYLLSQFDVLGYKGLRFLNPLSLTYEQDKRELIKRTTDLHKYKGTSWSIKETLKLIGITDCEFYTNVQTTYHDGTILRNGTNGYAQSEWATFNLKINVATFSTFTPQIISDIINIVNEYKPLRSRLIKIIGFGISHNGQALRNGTHLRNPQIIIV
jgi:P2-related tail formation protein